MKVKSFLIVSCYDGSVRTVKKNPKLGVGEVAYQLEIDVPDAWREIQGTVTLNIPPPPPNLVEVREVRGGRAKSAAAKAIAP